MKNAQIPSGLPINQFGQESKIPIDTELHITKPLDANNISKPIILTIGIHVAIIFFVIYANLIPEIKQQPMVETMIYTQDELTKLQSDIETNRITVAAQAMKSDGDNSNGEIARQNKQTTKSTSVSKQSSNAKASSSSSSSANNLPAVPISPEMQAINKKIAEQQRQFDEAMRRSANKLDNDAKKEKQQQIDARQKKQRERQKKVEEFKAVETKDSTEEELIFEEFETFKPEKSNSGAEALKIVTDNAKTSKQPKKERIIRKSMGVGQSRMSRNQYNNGYANGYAPTTQGTRTPSISVDDAIASKIKRNLVAPEGSKGFTSIVSIQVDSSGFVKNATARGENLALNDACQQAVYKSSPLPTLGSNRVTFTVRLNGR